MSRRWVGVLAILLAGALTSALAAFAWVGYDDDDPLSRAAFVVVFLVCLGPALALSAVVALWLRRWR